MEWISVNDELPHPSQWVLCLTKGDIGEEDMVIAQHFNDEWHSQYKGFCKENVTHWMPLPQKPKR